MLDPANDLSNEALLLTQRLSSADRELIMGSLRGGNVSENTSRLTLVTERGQTETTHDVEKGLLGVVPVVSAIDGTATVDESLVRTIFITTLGLYH